jgi:hypothetical protein
MRLYVLAIVAAVATAVATAVASGASDHPEQASLLVGRTFFNGLVEVL